jgi:hypothetical protein
MASSGESDGCVLSATQMSPMLIAGDSKKGCIRSE